MLEIEANQDISSTRLLRMAIYSLVPTEEIIKRNGQTLRKDFPDIVHSCIGKKI
jgi:hypothetical protein